MSQEIAVNSRGVMQPANLSEAMEFAKLVAGSSMVPAPFRGKAGDVLIAIQMGAELGLAPMQALQNIAVISGKPAVYGDALMGLVRSSPLCESVVETYEGAGDNLEAVCVARRRGQPEPVVGRFSVADAKRAKLWGKAGPWSDYPKIMLKHRARGFALRDAFADLLRGVITREEADDYPASRVSPPIDVTPRADLDRFAALPAVEEVDDALRLAAEATAAVGTADFRAWWKGLTGTERDALRPDMDEYKRVAEAADRFAAQAASDEDPFGLPPPADTEQPSQDAPAPAERPGVQAPSHAAPSRQGDLSIDDEGGVDDGDYPTVPLPARPTAEQLDYYARQLLALIAEQPLSPQRAARIRLANEGGIGWLKLKAVATYDEVMRALNEKAKVDG